MYFKPLLTAGIATDVMYQPVKSSWSPPICQAVCMAYPIMCGKRFILGSLKVDPQALVFNADDETISGVNAAGIIVAMYYGTDTGATSVLRGAVFGRIAGHRATDGATDGAADGSAEKLS